MKAGGALSGSPKKRQWEVATEGNQDAPSALKAPFLVSPAPSGIAVGFLHTISLSDGCLLVWE